ncbi:septum site-determining protein MinC [Companilactobacillus pabuli]|jgi:Septum formation inhibitor|uniref:Septum formation initiator n=1 Tax=Companilactobacillus pabuli TaxID=2714036 RepID=A0A7L7KYE8_9LACO|nr:septum site-determining protein MinC [Companilactobacillus pabuli]AKP04121.1 septum formation initiator [Companilactobacillus farciminis]AKS52427.1 septum formation initiator [Companilactobacillus farciminis]MDG5113397.1 septum site-determining protein MinC [Companilactobacillus pabuli]QMT83808.1 septum formation initiator [Companilactobacillus pabuli]GAQ01309.1 septum formation initiator [Companilactobacillus farciminis]
MSDIILKGDKNGFSVIIDDKANYGAALKEMKDLIIQQNAKSTNENDDVIYFTVKTGHRLLTEDQKNDIRGFFDEYPQLTLKDIEADVEDNLKVADILKANRTNVESGIVRSGQKIDYEGDLIFLGTLHRDAQVRASGSIYILGDVDGIVQAGYPDNTDAMIFGNLNGVDQLRIADVIEIVTDDNKKDFQAGKYAFIDDLHSISIDDLKNYKR